MADRFEARPRRGRRRVLITAGGTVVLLGCGIGAYASTTSTGARYRTAVAGPAQIDQTIDAVGTAAPASPKTYAFSTSGTVAAVNVKVGDKVAAGQTLASLDPTSLNNTLAQAQLTLAKAQLTLENDQTGTSSSSSSSSSSNSSSSQTRTPAVGAAGPSSADITAAQKAVTTAQQTVDADLAAQQTLLTAASTTCGDPSKTPTDCQTAQQAVSTAQAKTSTDEAALLTAEKQLNTLLTQLAASTSTTTPTSGSGNSGASSAPTVKVASAEQLAADQAAIDAATAQVNVAQENLARASLVANGGGTVISTGLTVGSAVSANSTTISTGLTVGSAVSANSTTATVVVADPSSYAFSLTVPVTALNTLAVGNTASVVPDGTSKKLPGKVTAIGLAPTTSGGSTYAVTIGLDEQPTGLRSGMSAAVTVSTSTIQSAVAVPTSALTRTDSTYSVRTLNNGKVTTKTVQIGTSGLTLTDIRSGLAAGDVVVLADRHTKIPSSTTNNRLVTGLTGSGLTGGGLTGGGLTGGGLGGGGLAGGGLAGGTRN